MTTPSTTPSPTLPIDWTPTSSGCLRKNDLWIWDFGNTVNDARTVLGGPSQTTDCFASTWNPTVTYAGSGCPSHYTPACQASNSGVVTCCPTAYEFGCQPETSAAGDHAQWFQCQKTYINEDVVTLTRTDFDKETADTETRTKHSYEHLFALAVMYTTPPSSSTSATTSLPNTMSTTSSGPSTTDTPSKNASSRLTAGAAAGIGVGAAAGVIILALLAWLVYRRRRRARQSKEVSQFHTSATPIAPTPGTTVTYTSTAEGTQGPAQYLSQPLATPTPKELPADQIPVFELDGEQRQGQRIKGDDIANPPL
ncbi:hypothetical protein F5Y09DRAFT_297140 [Xylaria sp. FL1042]|nr:hypothetical protein F5Y09DRAFT_297140 [Xylaria sp. FL1042]